MGYKQHQQRYIYILCYPPKDLPTFDLWVAHVLDILFLAAYIITWCRIIEGKYPFRCQKIHTYIYIYMIIFIDIYIYMIIYIIIYICVHTCTWLLHCDLSRSLKIKHVWKRHGTVSKCKDFTWCSFLCLGLLQHFTPNLNNFSCLYLNVLKGLCQEAFGNMFFFFKEECCTVWKSLWRVLPTGLVLHPLMQMNIIVMIQHCWRNQYTIQNTVMNPITNLYQVVLRISEECSTMFLSFPKEYYALVSI